jgi:rhomboid protease GluP
MRIFGTICQADTGRAIANLIVRAYGRDLLFDELLGYTTTAGDGSFEIRTATQDATTRENSTEIFLRVLDPTGEHEVYDTLAVPRPGSGTDQNFQISLPPENLGPSFERRDRSADTPQEFVQALHALTPRAFVTPSLVVLNVLAFAWLMLQGASPLSPDIDLLAKWGGNAGLYTPGGEWWRLVSCLFLHGSVLHLVLNCYVLWVAGNVVERLVGSASFAALYLASGVIASLTSLAWNPFTVSVGASGAIFGVWGALIGYALRQRDPVTLRGLLRLRNVALLFLGLNLIIGMLQEQVDMAAHVGGLVAGIGAGLLLSQPVSLKSRVRRGRRLALLCLVASLLVVSIAAALPRRAIVIQSELEHFNRVRLELSEKFDDSFGSGELSLAEMGAVLEELLPQWNEARARVEELEGLPSPLQAQVDEAVRVARKQEAEWRTLAGDFGRFQKALSELQQLELRASERYQEALAAAQAGTLTNDEFVDVLYREVLSEWDFPRKIAELDNLREPLQTLAAALRAYADTRENAWRLYVEAVRTRNAELAQTASEQHLRADSMIAGWAGVEVQPGENSPPRTKQPARPLDR